MKWPSVLLICALAPLFNACEKHPASELEGTSHGPEAHAPAHAPAATVSHDKENKVEEAKPGEAPKFFPEKK